MYRVAGAVTAGMFRADGGAWVLPSADGEGMGPPERRRRVPYQPGLKGQVMGFKTGKRAEGPKHIED